MERPAENGRDPGEPAPRTGQAPIVAVARGMALFWALLIFLDLVARWRTPVFDATTWWIDLRTFPASAAQFLLASTGALVCPDTYVRVKSPHGDPSGEPGPANL